MIKTKKRAPVVRVDGVWKRYGLPPLKFRRRSASDDRGGWALKNVSFEVRPGEILGIIGRNGAGKSTLLKILAGVTPPTRGAVYTKGRLFPMIELTAGMHMDLTGRENVRLLGTLMGLTKRSIEQRMSAIEEFCELGEWFDRPVGHYSSGMLSRIGFAVAINVNADAMLIDEVLAVGDLAFQRKCYGIVERRRQSGCAVLLVSHSLRHILRLADRAIMLADGEIVAEGEPRKIVERYEELTSLGKTAPDGARKFDATYDRALISDPHLEICGSHVMTETPAIRTHESLTVRFRFNALEPIVRPELGFAITSSEGVPLMGVTTDGQEIDRFPAGPQTVECTFRSLPLLPGTYGILSKMLVERGATAAFKSNLPLQFKVNQSGIALAQSALGFIIAQSDWRFSSG